MPKSLIFGQIWLIFGENAYNLAFLTKICSISAKFSPPFERSLRKFLCSTELGRILFYSTVLWEEQGVSDVSLPHGIIFGAETEKFKFFLNRQRHSDGQSSSCAEPIWMSSGYVVALNNVYSTFWAKFGLFGAKFGLFGKCNSEKSLHFFGSSQNSLVSFLG